MTDLPTPKIEDESYDFGYKVAVFFLAGNYAAEQVRTQQSYADARGSNLSKDQISDIFKKSAEYMVERIERTSI